MRTPRTRGESDIYHVISRGVGQQIVFESDGDRSRYLGLLHKAVSSQHGDVLAWCLMDNHIHLLVRLDMDKLSKAMRRINSSYALYFNQVHGRTGHLFQGRFLSEPVDTDEYLMTVLRYIHRNPVKGGLTKTCSYAWSSYDAYASGEIPAGAEFIADMFGSSAHLVEFHEMDDEATCLEIPEIFRRFSDEDALKEAVGLFGEAGLHEIKALPRNERRAALSKMKGIGLTVRQIQRLTGVSLATISRA